MNKPSFPFLVRNSSKVGVVAGFFLFGVGASFPMKDEETRLLIESGVSTIASDPAIKSVTLNNGWDVTRFTSKELPPTAVRKFNKSRQA